MELQELRERRAPLLDEPEGTVAAPGHTLVIDYSGTVDGQPFDGGSAEGAILELGADAAAEQQPRDFQRQRDGVAGGVGDDTRSASCAVGVMKISATARKSSFFRAWKVS